MSDALLVNFIALQEASAHIQTAIGALESQLAQLEKDAAPLVETWSGDAKDAYLARQAQWRQASGDLSAMLRNIKKALDDSYADYQRTESQNAGLFNGVPRSR